MNKLHQADIYLLEDEHRYRLLSDPTLDFSSVTQIVARYFEPFDKHAVALKLVKTHPKYFGMSTDELISDWDARRDYGTKVHKEIESFIQSGKKPSESRSIDAIQWLENHNTGLKVFTEVLIYSKEYRIAGSIDILLYDEESDYYNILDWKTSKAITKTSFKGKTGIHSTTKHLMDCKYIHYSLQLSFYRYLLEKCYGLNIKQQFIAHLDGSSCIIHNAPYYRKEIVNIIGNENS